MPIFLISPDRIQGSKALLDENESHHLVNVLRKKEGETISLANGRGESFEGKIVKTQGGVTLEILSSSQKGLEDSPQLILCPALLKNPRMDWLIEKATELGAHSIFPFLSERGVVKVPSAHDEDSKRKRWERIAAAAVKQSGRGWLPQIGPLLPLDALLEKMKGLQALRFLFTPESKKELKESEFLLKENPPLCIIMIGPEGGWAAKELEAAQKAGFHLISLGGNTLRGETAAVATLSVIQFLKTK